MGDSVCNWSMAEGGGFEPNLSPFFTFTIYKGSMRLMLNRKFREIFIGLRTA